MKKSLINRIQKLLEEERKAEVDNELLNLLRSYAAGETDYSKISPSQRNALNTFFSEVKQMVFNEFMTGDYGAEIIIESAIILSFEVGYKLRQEELQLPNLP